VTLALAGFHVSADVVVLGVVTGMVYGVLAVGLVLVYRSSRIINFAHGEIGAFGAALLGAATLRWHVPYWAAFALALAVSGALGAASDVLVIRRLRAAPLVITVIATLGLGQLISICSALVNHSAAAGVTYPQPAWFPRFSLGALLITPAYSTMLLVTPAVVVAIAYFLQRGRLGIAMRASAANPDAARMSGILAGRMSTLAWAIAGALAAYTAILVLPTRGFSTGAFLGPGLLLRGLACAVVGRMVNLPRAVAAGLALGVAEQLLLANYPSGGLVEVVLFLVILVALASQRARRGRTEDKSSWSAVQAFRPLPRALRQVPSVRRLGWAVAGLAFPVGLLLPELTSNATATTFSLIAAFSTVGLSVGLVTGLGGQLSLGQFAIAAVGATVSYVVVHSGGPFLLGVTGAAATAAAVSLVIAVPAVRIRGLMLAVTTLGFALAAESWLLQQPWMLGRGVVSRRPTLGGFSFSSGKRYYLVAFAVLVAACWLARNVWAGGLGRRMRAVRDNEDAARAFGVGATAVKLQTFVMAGVLAGLGGAVYGHLLANQAANAYPIDASISAAAVAVIGGLGVVVGPILGALYIIGLPRFVPLDNVGLAATAAGWLLLILRYPGGVAQGLAPLRDQIVDSLARRAGLDPDAERAVRQGGEVGRGGLAFALPRRAPNEAANGEPILRAERLSKSFGGLVAVSSVTLEARAGEILGLIGPNGAGKTTLFELLSGFSRPDSGRVWFDGEDVTDARPERRAGLGLIRSFQEASLFPTMTVHEVVMLALERSDPTRVVTAVSGSRSAERRKAKLADELLDAVGLGSYADTEVSALSTGTRRIAELACLVGLQPTVLLLDEPTSGIAQRETEALGAVLRQVRSDLDLTLVVIEHDIPLVMSLADRIAVMETGALLTVGDPSTVRADPRVVESYLGGDLRAIERSTHHRRAVAAGSSTGDGRNEGREAAHR
jgi:ABC-type branched-subunit amino acid transport system ATPase component/branched-subunit amino acid ABC-type transport system permease component